MADVAPPPVDTPSTGPIAKTTVTVTVAGVALAIVTLISSAISANGGELLQPTRDAIQLLLTGIFGWLIHSIAVREDRMAFHRWVLSRLGSRPAPPPPSVTTTPIRPSPMGDVRP